MKILILLFGVFIVLMSLIGFVSPSRLLGMVRWIRTPAGFLIAVALRLIMGVILYLAASSTRFPLTMEILGVIMVLAGIGLLFFGRERFAAFIDGWMKQPPALIRIWLLFAVAFGGFLIYAAN